MSTALVRCSFVAVALTVAATIAGCGAGPGEPVGETTSAITGFANDKTAFDYFLGKGLANYQAAGIVGNLDQESGVDPTAVQSGGPGRGIAQWSVGGRWDTDTDDNAEWYATQQGQSVDSLTLQLDFVWYELTTFSGYGLASLQASTNVTDATVAFQNDFEGCGTCDQSTRIAYAENVLAEYGNDTVDGGGSSGGSGDDAGTPCTVPGLGDGVCILTTDCAAMPGHVSTPNYCPGPADIECCTGPADDGGTTGSDGGKTGSSSGSSSGGSSSGSSSGGSSGSSSGASSGGSSGTSSGGTASGSSGGSSGSTHPGTGGTGDTTPATGGSGSGGCSTTSAGATGSLAGWWMTGLAWLASRRRRNRASKKP